MRAIEAIVILVVLAISVDVAASESTGWTVALTAGPLTTGELDLTADISIDESDVTSALGRACVSADAIWMEVKAPGVAPGYGALQVVDRSCAAPYANLSTAIAVQLPSDRVVPFTVTLYLVRDGSVAEWTDRVWLSLVDGRPTILRGRALLDALSKAEGVPTVGSQNEDLEVGNVPGEGVLGPFEKEGRCVGNNNRCPARGRNSWRQP